ncbi:mitochondrial import inner membrane translocase subunit tim8 a [Plakobranchus ocellatus]|uniref:Mitochondrial import inner membrane translocase subunit n=1 Tax=Plakobranchus ocellatus TaxID=259542 RepID=A0AAV4DTX4_9GAST|nr:mitochondrial import inner membrane translocase subunit tim8 a [Plakobranchus ocellatus]
MTEGKRSGSRQRIIFMKVLNHGRYVGVALRQCLFQSFVTFLSLELSSSKTSDRRMNAALQDPGVQRFVNQETQKQRFHGLVHEMTDRCWDTCMGNPSTKLDSKTENCIRNCVDRFLDTSNFVVNRLESTPVSSAAPKQKSSGSFLYN